MTTGEARLPLLEREREAATLEALIARAHRGEGAAVVIEGPAGIGKTRLCGLAREAAAAQGMEVLAARASEHERLFSYGVARQLFERPLAELSAGEREGLLAGAASSAGAALGLGEGDAGGVPDAPFRVIHGLYWLAANLAARRALLLCVDDVHWSDAASLRWLGYLARRSEELPILLVLAVRSGERADDPALETLVVAPDVQVLRPRALSVVAIERMATTMLEHRPGGDFATACHAATGGNPLLVRELLTTFAEEDLEPTASAPAEVAPVSVAAWLEARLGRLGPGARELANAAAVLGDGVPLELVLTVAGEVRDAEVLASSLVAAEILAEEHDEDAGTRLAFAHPLLRSAIYSGLTVAERTAGHRAAGRLLAERRAPAEEVARHALAAGVVDERWATASLREAGGTALAGGDPEAAVRYLRAACGSRPADVDPDLSYQLGVAEARCGAPGAEEHLTAAVGALTDPPARAQAAFELATFVLMHGEAGDAVRHMDHAIDAAAAVDRELALRFEAAILPVLRARASTAARGAPRLEHLRGLAGDTPAERALLAVLAGDDAASGRGTAAAVAALARRAAADGRMLDAEGSDSPAIIALIAALVLSDQLAAADNLLTAALEDSGRRGSLLSFCVLAGWRALVSVRSGRLERAIEDARAAERISEDLGVALDRTLILGCGADALRERGRLADAEALLETLPVAAFADAGSFNAFLHSRALVRAARGALQTAIDDLLAAGDHVLRWRGGNPMVLPWRSNAALLLARAGEPERARELVEEEQRLADAYGAASAIGIALRARGLLAAGGERIELLRAAVEACGRSEARLAHARALASLGSALRQVGAPDARETLELALDAAQRLGAEALEQEVRGDLVATGARPRRRAGSGAAALTPSERRAAELAAAGSTNSEIAQALFLATRTVEMHLTNAYRKLGIGSRTQLPDALDS